MLSDDEAVAVLLGLIAGSRAGLATTSVAATESATAKLRRVLPDALARRLAALLDTAEFTLGARAAVAPSTDVLLTMAEAPATAVRCRSGIQAPATVAASARCSPTGSWPIPGAGT